MTSWTHTSSHWTLQNKIDVTQDVSTEHSPSPTQYACILRMEISCFSAYAVPPIPSVFPRSLTASILCPLSAPSKRSLCLPSIAVTDCIILHLKILTITSPPFSSPTSPTGHHCPSEEGIWVLIKRLQWRKKGSHEPQIKEGTSQWRNKN